MIQVDGVAKSFKGRDILQDVSFSVGKGEVVGLLGPNGAGKTTMIRLLNGVISADTGTIRVNGLDPLTDGDNIRRNVGVVTESAGLYPEMNGRENLLFFAKLYNCVDKKRIDWLLELLGLSKHGDKPVGTYSTGMKKRLAIAKAVLHEPALLFLDEPTNGLDPDGILDVIGYLRKLNYEQGTTILICSHILYQLEEVCSSYLFLERGRIIERGTLRELEARYVEEVILNVETGFNGAGNQAAGYPFTAIGDGKLQFKLPSKEHIPGLLRSVLEESWVHSAEIMNNDLEALYFEVRRRSNES
ncbi:Linearmycin resistance ATP-binding protein LnrL [Paenibacillus plantiphilus]|uniref:Linearmycin resistance ATP-binding protein LnrL n=1 Tax=Paenibacillus plantiphilus TaxID=2905650 RepID=A0ABM9CQX6_9BACL|nr:ABC transporter ATP-binding protein [Paenibacillus plantiphilus]CAH1221869.1 Linearmycin resistance ATP-binding protein LnrL [Paenibacillus plantiphilus]